MQTLLSSNLTSLHFWNSTYYSKYSAIIHNQFTGNKLFAASIGLLVGQLFTWSVLKTDKLQIM